jgi:hypothetical protein
MAVRVGKIELIGLNKVYTEDTRNLVKLRGPGQIGGVYQDLGREPVTVVMEGILLGDDTNAALEELRLAQAKAKPMSFAADAVAGADLTQVLIADFQVRQLAGYKDRFAFFLRVREYTELPEAEGAGAAKVQADAATDAAAWQKGAVDAAALEQDPSSLAAKIEENPDLVAHLSGDKLGELVGKNADAMSGQSFGNVLGAVGKANPTAIGGLVDSLKKQGKLGALISKLSEAGVKILNFVKNIKIGAVLAIFKMIAGGADLLAKLKAVVAAAGVVISKLGEVDLKAIFEPERSKSEVGVDRALLAVTDLVTATDDVLAADAFKALIEFVEGVNLEEPVRKGLQTIRAALEKVTEWAARLGRIAGIPRLFQPLVVMFGAIKDDTDMSRPGAEEELRGLALDEFIPTARITHEVMGMLESIHETAFGVVKKGLPEEEVVKLGDSLVKLKETIAVYEKQLAPKTPGAKEEGAG